MRTLNLMMLAVMVSTSVVAACPTQVQVVLNSATGTLCSISTTYGVSVARIQQANGLGTSTTLQNLQSLFIPCPPQQLCQPSFPVSTKSGDGLAQTANRFGIADLTAVEQLNPQFEANFDSIPCGTDVLLPGSSNDPPCGALLYEYIGVGNEPGIDFAISQSAVDVIPVPAASSQLPYYFIILGLTDQASPGVLSSGTFFAFGSYDQGNAPLQWEQADINNLKSRGTNVQVLASLGGDYTRTIWVPLFTPSPSNPDPSGAQMAAAVTAYVNKAVASLIAWQTTYSISGFDLDFENGLQGATGSTEPTWLSAYCQIVKQLKQAGSIITFAAFPGTEQAYVDLYQCVGPANVDYILYQTYAMFVGTQPDSAAQIVQGISQSRTRFAGTKFAATVATSQAADVVSSAVSQLFASRTILGAGVFSADKSVSLGSYAQESSVQSIILPST